MKFGKGLVLSCILAVLALPLVGAVSDASAQNILVNPGFETGDFMGWEVYGEDANASATVQSPVNGPSFGGTHNALLDNQAEARGLVLKQSTAGGSAYPGPVYYSFDLLLDQAEIGGVLQVEIFAEQAGGGVIGGSGVLGPFWAWNWTQYAGSFVAPANTDFLSIQVIAATGANIDSSCVAHADNLYLSQDTPVIATESMNWSGIKALYK